MKFGDEFKIGKVLYKLHENGITVVNLALYENLQPEFYPDFSELNHCCSGCDVGGVQPSIKNTAKVRKAYFVWLMNCQQLQSTNIFVFSKNRASKNYPNMGLVMALKRAGAKFIEARSSTHNTNTTLTVIYCPPRYRLPVKE